MTGLEPEKEKIERKDVASTPWWHAAIRIRPTQHKPFGILGPWRVFGQGVVLAKSRSSKLLRGTGWKVGSAREAVQPEIDRGTAQPGEVGRYPWPSFLVSCSD